MLLNFNIKSYINTILVKLLVINVEINKLKATMFFIDDLTPGNVIIKFSKSFNGPKVFLVYVDIVLEEMLCPLRHYLVVILKNLA